MDDGTGIGEFLAARDLLLNTHGDYAGTYRRFRWSRPERFNWALDYFDRIARDEDRLALWLVDEEGGEDRLTYAEMRERSNRVANYLRGLGVGRGDSGIGASTPPQPGARSSTARRARVTCPRLASPTSAMAVTGQARVRSGKISTDPR